MDAFISSCERVVAVLDEVSVYNVYQRSDEFFIAVLDGVQRGGEMRKMGFAGRNGISSLDHAAALVSTENYVSEDLTFIGAD